MQIPVGTWIVFSSKDDAEQFRALAINETKAGPTPATVVTIKPLQIISPAWIGERDAAELSLHKKIDELEAQLKNK